MTAILSKSLYSLQSLKHLNIRKNHLLLCKEQPNTEDLLKTKRKEAPQIDLDLPIVQQPKTILIEEEDLTQLAPNKERHVAQIHRRSRNVMQSGTSNQRHWEICFATRDRWENPLMGWCSSGDPMSGLELHFASKADAIKLCEKNGWSWMVREDVPKKFKVRTYGGNYHCNKRTRVSTK